MTDALSPVASLDQLLSAHQRVRADLLKQVAALNAHEASLRAELETCVTRRSSYEDQIRALDTTESLYRKMLGQQVPYVAEPQVIVHDADSRQVVASLPANFPKPPRARIGPQRYQMFIALRDLGPLTRSEIATKTNLSEKRVREQMLSDAQAGFVSERLIDEKLSLSPAGTSLLERFEAYKRSKGIRLAQLGEAADDADDQGDSESEETEGDTPSVSSDQQHRFME